MPTYQTTNPLARANPLRSIVMFRPAAEVLRKPVALYTVPGLVAAVDPDWQPQAPLVLTDRQTAERTLANAEAALREAVRCYDAARAGIGEANATTSKAVVIGGRVIVPAKAFSADTIRARKSAAFRLMNQRRRELNRDRRRVDAARAMLGLPSLAVVEEREVVAKVVRASKRRSIPIAQAALSV